MLVVCSYGTAITGTWNVGNKPPPDDFSGWIPKEGYDVITIGAQECEYKPRKEYASCQQDFCTTIAKYLGEQYQVGLECT